MIRDKADLRTLESVQTYLAGEWEQKLHVSYKECMKLSDQWNAASRLIDELATASHSPEEFIGLIEATGDIKGTTKLLALSSDWESTFGALSLSYSALGRCKEAEFVAETFLSIYPENADLHLALGNLFLGALINSNPPPGDSISFLRKTIETTGNMGSEFLESLKQSDPPLYRELTDKEYAQSARNTREMLSQVTLKALDCSYDHACKKAEEQFREALKLSRKAKTSEQARSAIATLIMTRKINER